MSKLRELIKAGPKLCGVKNYERWEEVFLHAFDSEIVDKMSVFASKEGETIEDRTDVLNGLFNARGAKFTKVSYWVGLVQLCATSYAISKGRTDLAVSHDLSKAFLESQEQDNKEFASLMTVQEASMLTYWE